ncbi:hypothetical protein O7627_10845 [Solwaraspora sp. WMMD1047]|uniref:hypothetical protein n=1 Tax=Solwaraspora sp. WMMD1047 TaxID=3016102 RepID=UPI0024173CDB|nr:hypothetical protein [Solwaraspora sp. WMMD1047]MDG4829797.1 hypothetical protein [Solwaraspora sp. WMMD1047]
MSRLWRRPARADLLAVGVYLLLGALVCGNHWADIQGRVSSHLPTDNSWFEWLFSHGAYSVRHLTNPLFSDRQNAPDGVNMMANTSMLGVTLPMAPITILFGPQVAYVLYLVVAMAGTAATSYWALSRHLVTSRAAAFVGGAFLGFAPGIVHHANGQPNFVSNFLLPIILVWVLRLGEPGRWLRNGLILGLLVTYQIFINEEMLLLTALACAVIVPLWAAARWRRLRDQAVPFLLALGVGGGLTLLLAGYPIWFQFNGPQSYRSLQGGIFHSWGEDVQAFVTFARDTLAGSPEAEQTIGMTEQNTWFGWPLVIVAVLAAGLLWRRSLAARIATTVGVLFAVASLGPQLRIGGELTERSGPWSLIPPDLPLVEMMMPTRLSLVTVGAVGVLLALAWDAVATAAATRPATSVEPDRSATAAQPDQPTRSAGPEGPADRPGRRWLPVVGYAAIALALLPLVPRPLPVQSVEPPPTFITSGDWRPYVPDGRTLVPVPIPSNVHGLSTLRWSALTLHEFPVPGGYFIGPGPEGLGQFGAPTRPTAALIYRVMDGVEEPITGEQRAQAVEDLRFWNASVVVLGDHPSADVLLPLMTDLLGPAQRVSDVWLWDVRPLVG